MQDRPTAAELLATITEYLEGEVLPNVEGTLRYHTLVAANLNKILEREMNLYPAAAADERRLLRGLLDADDRDDRDDRDDGDDRDDLVQLNRRLAERLLAPGPAEADFERAAWEVLSVVTAAKLAINKPGYDSYDLAQEVR